MAPPSSSGPASGSAGQPSVAESALAALPVAVLVWQPAAEGWAYANSSACNLFGLDRETLIATPATRLFGDQQTRQLAGAYDEIRRGRESVSIRALPLPASKVSRAVDVHMSVMTGEQTGQVVLLLIGSDATSQIRSRRNDKNEAIGRMAGGLAHDFNNLLSVVLSCSQLLMAELPADSPLRRDCEAIHKAGMQAADLTEQLLAVGRQSMLEPETVDINQIVRDMDPVIRTIIGPSRWLLFEPSAEPRQTVIPPSHVEQIVMNLVMNARDALPQGGEIAVRTRTVTLDSYGHGQLDPGDYVLLEVEDSGIGMEPHVQERIFDPFFTTKAGGHSRGMGLGLSTVLGIVEQCHGAIDVSSTPGSGTYVKVYLPAQRVARSMAEPIQPRQRVGRKATVLLVDDDDEVRDVAVRILETDGYQVISAARPSEALRRIRSDGAAIDLLLTDVVMPEMHGPDLARQARSQLPHVRIVLMSGYVDNLVDPKQLEEFDATFVQKPLTPRRLLQSIQDALNR